MCVCVCVCLPRILRCNSQWKTYKYIYIFYDFIFFNCFWVFGKILFNVFHENRNWICCFFIFFMLPSWNHTGFSIRKQKKKKKECYVIWWKKVSWKINGKAEIVVLYMSNLKEILLMMNNLWGFFFLYWSSIRSNKLFITQWKLRRIKEFNPINPVIMCKVYLNIHWN